MVNAARPSRADYYKVLADKLPANALVVTWLGNASYLWAAMHHAPENFYFEDAMGLALPLALGLAVAQPARPVIVVEGDGALLMHMGALVTIGAVAPDNLTVLLIQNGVHAASGGQALTNANLDLAALARSSGIARARMWRRRKHLPRRWARPDRQWRTGAGAVDRAGHRSGQTADCARSGPDKTPLHDRDRRAALYPDHVRRRTAGS